VATIHKFTGDSTDHKWDQVEAESYAGGATRRVLIGPDDGAGNFALRYFEIPPNAKSTLDRHEHDHGVYVLKGRGNVHIEGEDHPLLPGDTVYIAPNDEHHFEAEGHEPFGFLCIIPPK